MIQVEDYVGEKQLDLRSTYKQQDYSVWADFFCRDRCHSRSGARTVPGVGEEQSAAEIVWTRKQLRSHS